MAFVSCGAHVKGGLGGRREMRRPRGRSLAPEPVAEERPLARDVHDEHLVEVLAVREADQGADFGVEHLPQVGTDVLVELRVEAEGEDRHTAVGDHERPREVVHEEVADDDAGAFLVTEVGLVVVVADVDVDPRTVPAHGVEPVVAVDRRDERREAADLQVAAARGGLDGDGVDLTVEGAVGRRRVVDRDQGPRRQYMRATQVVLDLELAQGAGIGVGAVHDDVDVTFVHDGRLDDDVVGSVRRDVEDGVARGGGLGVAGGGEDEERDDGLVHATF